MKKIIASIVALAFVPLVALAGVNGQPSCTVSANLSPVLPYPKTVTITWETRNAVAVTSDPDIGATAASGTAFYVASGPGTFTLTAINSKGKTGTCSVSVR